MEKDAFITKARKRTREEVDERELDARSFTIKLDASDPFAAPRTFSPLCLLSRAQLPLAYLDTSCSGSRLFSAHVDLLESAYVHDDDATVLVAAEAKEKKLYAIERVKKKTYALCRLGTWVTEDDMLTRSRCDVRDGTQSKRRALQVEERGKPWWMSAAVNMDEPVAAMKAQSVRLDVKNNDMILAEPEVSLFAGQTRPTEETQDTAANLDPLPESVQCPIDVMQDLVKHYLEALYLSRTSLAYFTKGPLSRARAAFAAMEPSAASAELVSFLRDSVLTSTTMDKKFKDSISDIVKELPAAGMESPEQPKKTKRKRKWKSKRDKHGFYTDEKDAVEHWWRDHDNFVGSPSSGETTEGALRRRVPRLRSRETFLQLILILETLALEAALPAMEETAGAATKSNVLESQQQETQTDGAEKKKKAKKKQDLSSLLETLLDKLCIWHSLDLHSPAKKRTGDVDERDHVDDELKSFCSEVIVPFYVSRIPEQASVVNKKLGGPSAPTPVKRSKSAISRKPGESVTRPAPEKKPRKPLSRVATDTLNRHSKTVPSLNRSATDTDVLTSYIKRETSEVPMDSIPATNQPRRPRQSLMHTLDSSRRQVDLNSISQANNNKVQKQAEMREKMQSAINMLRKPNRAAALADVRDQTDESFAKATAANKGRGGGQKGRIAPQRPHVTATPSHRRTVKATPHRRAADVPQEDCLESSGTTHVTSSTTRLARVNHDMVPSSSFAIPQTGHRPRHSGVEETPSRGFAKFMPAGLARQPGTLESPVASRKVAATPSKPVRSLSLGVSATPVTQRLPTLVEGSPNVQRHAVEQEGGMSGATKDIYGSLGWDEEEYEELT